MLLDHTDLFLAGPAEPRMLLKHLPGMRMEGTRRNPVPPGDHDPAGRDLDPRFPTGRARQ